MSERHTITINRGNVYAVAGRKWQLPGLAGRLRAVRYLGEQCEGCDLLQQRELAPVVRLDFERRQ